MKSPFIYFSISTVLLCFALLSCSGDDESIEDDTRKLLIAHSWKSTNVVVDGVNRNELFKDFSVTFLPNSYTAVQGDPVWPTTGTWSFVDSSAKSFTRADGAVVTIELLTPTSLRLSLPWAETTLGQGRTSSLKGKHTFEFSK